MCAVINFVYYGMETALFVLMIFSCSYLYLLSSRSRLTIPIMDSDQKRHFEIQNLSVDTNAKYLTVSKKYRKDRAESIKSRNNSSHLLKSNHDYCASIDHEENLPLVSIIVPARRIAYNIQKYMSLFPHVSAAIQLRKYPLKGDTIQYIYTDSKHNNPLCRVVPIENLSTLPP